jgi:hypothetical protein
LAASIWSTERLALLVLMAFVASAVIGIVILSSRPRSFGYAALAGLIGGLVLRLTPGGKLVAARSADWLAWVGQPLLGVVYALALAAVFEVLLSPQVPLLRRARPYGRRALRPWLWGTSAEIAETAGVASWVPEMLGVAVEPRPLSAQQLLQRARIIASVVCGTCVGVFFVVPAFRHALADTLMPGHILVNLIVTAFVTFLLGPLHEEVIALSGSGHHSGAVPHAQHRRLGATAGLFAVTGLLLVLLQAVHSAIHKQVDTLTLYDWILLLELCALPLLVTTYYFGAALDRVELGDRRWDRALQASIFAGTLVMMPFTVAYILVDLFPPQFRDSLLAAFASFENIYRLAVLAAVMVLAAILVGTVAAVIASAATYGVYALALGLAMLESTPATVRKRACVAVVIAGIVAQGLTSVVVWWSGVGDPVLHWVHLALAAGWACGLYASQFQQEMAQPEPAGTVPAAIR